MSWAPVSSGGAPAATAIAAPPVPGGAAASAAADGASRPAVPAQAGAALPPGSGYTDGRPGFVPMRPMAMGEILDGAMAMLRHAPAATLGLGAIVLTIQMVLTLPLQFVATNFQFAFTTFSESPAADPFLALVGFGLTAMVVSVITATCGGILSGFMACAVGDSSVGQPVTLGSVWRQGRTRLWALTGLSLIVGLLQLLGAAVLGLGWLFFTAVFAVAVPVLMLERAKVFQAMGRSWNLTIKDVFRVLGIRLLAIIVGAVLSWTVAIPLAVAGQVILTESGTDPSAAMVFLSVFCAGIGAMIGGILTSPFLGCVDAFLYIDRRMRSEGLDIEVSLRSAVRPVAVRANGQLGRV